MHVMISLWQLFDSYYAPYVLALRFALPRFKKSKLPNLQRTQNEMYI